MSWDQKCRVCGCVESKACVTAAGPCYWVEKNLCSACAGKEYDRIGIQMDPATELIAVRPLKMTLSFYQAFCLVSTVQLACRHPQFTGEPRIEMENLARELQKVISVSGQWRFILEAGWDQSTDIEGTIIIPP